MTRPTLRGVLRWATVLALIPGIPASGNALDSGTRTGILLPSTDCARPSRGGDVVLFGDERIPTCPSPGSGWSQLRSQAPAGSPSPDECLSGLVDTRCEEWVSRFDNPYSHAGGGFKGDLLRDMVLSPDGKRLYATGVTWDERTGSELSDRWDWLTVAFDAGTGEKLWNTQYNGDLNQGDSAYDIAISPDGQRVYVTGITDVQDRFDYATVAYDAVSGDQLWVARQNGPLDAVDWAQSLAMSPDGSTVYVTGHTSGSNGFDVFTVAYAAATGATMWTARWAGPGGANDWGFLVDADPDGDRVYVAGSTERLEGGSTRTEIIVLAYEAKETERSGQLLWESRFVDPTRDFESDVPNDMAIGADGTVFLTGRVWRGIVEQDVSGCFCYDFGTAAFRGSDGVQQWTARYRGPHADFNIAYGLAVDPESGRVFVTGGASGELPSGLDYDIATVAYDVQSGNELWARSYSGLPFRVEAGGAVAVSSDGESVYTTGYSAPDWPIGEAGFIVGPLRYEGSSADFTTIKYVAATGEEGWVARYNSSAAGNDTDIPYAVAASPDGNHVYVGGQFWNQVDPQGATYPAAPYRVNLYDYGMVAYEA